MSKFSYIIKLRIELAQLLKSKNISTTIIFIGLLLLIKIPVEATVAIGAKNNLKSPSKNLLAQSEQPNRDRFTQPDRELIEPNPEEKQPILPQQKPTIIPEPDTKDEDIKIFVKEINITGSTIFSQAELQPITRQLEGQEVTLSQLRNAAKTITKKYLNLGYITSRAIVPQQEIKAGIIEIKVIEGRIANIQIDGNNRLNNSFIQRRLELGTNTPVRIDNLEGQLQLLRANGAIDNIEANLQPAPGEGESSLVVNVKENSPWLYGVEINNYSTVATGAERISFNLGHRNLTGNSDRLMGTFTQALSASSFAFDTSYSLPVNPKDGTLQLRARINRNEIVGGDFDDLDLEGDSELYEVSFRQPLTRTLRKEFALSLGFSFQESRDFFNGVRLNETIRTSTIKFGQDYTKRDIKGVWAFRSQLNLGFDGSDDGEGLIANNDEQPSDVFISWLGQAQRAQRINPNNLLILQADLQFTPSNLSTAEQFVIGGAQSVRGYRQNARLGDNGLRLSVEDRITIIKNENSSPLQIAPFADLGVVWGDSTEDTDDNFLAGIGLGIISEPVSGLTLRLDYAPPLIDIEEVGDNVQEDGFYFRIGYRN